ncbi:hypothetical protein SEA_STICKYNOTE_86 [Corynebacterium phage Stickynote]|uniref:Uncharacterized protein n=1 Tax=Corynebacterium phage Stickynote TaxID=2588503 RepID=A0A4Y6ETQ4_9CAUD|nr:hypothetical protein KNU65_gp56 [Corynebacterium phage Stickynote]QDF19279.1 hypothetical protein SEA_STICKYNOTE_86 [Corynebacterium phage Stickynote]
MAKDIYKGRTAKQWYDIAVEMASEYSDFQRTIAERQRRERKENTVRFGVEDLTTGEIKHEFSDYTSAMEASKFYPDSQVVTWITTPKKPVGSAEEDSV